VAWIIAGGSLFVAMMIAHTIIVIKVARMLEQSPPLNADDPAPNSDVEQFTFATKDGLKLNGCLFIACENQRPRGLILFCHELGSNCWSARSYCSGLIAAGFNVLAFDFRNHGSSESQDTFQPLHWLSEYEVLDVQAAIDLIKQRDDLKDLPLGLFGVSRGAGAALSAAAQHPEIQFVATEGAYSSHWLITRYSERWVSMFAPAGRGNLYPKWHVEITLAWARWIVQRKRNFRFVKLERLLTRLKNRNVLMIVGKRDNYARPEMAKVIYSQFESEKSDYWLVSGAGHNQARSMDPTAYDDRLITFFNRMTSDQVSVTSADLAAGGFETDKPIVVESN
jgi:pimeloyl-ACP methyl ester carboxylesterase